MTVTGRELWPRVPVLALAVLQFLVAGCVSDIVDSHNPDDYDSVPPDSVLVLFPTQAVVPADGISGLTISARIVPDHPDLRTVSFRSTGGTIVGAKEGAVEVAANELGIATIRLISGTQPDTVMVRASLGGVIRESQITFAPLSAVDFVTVELSASEIDADSTSTVVATARVHASAGAPVTNVEFSLSAGSFLGVGLAKSISVRSDLNGTATATIKSSARAGPVLLSTSVGVATVIDSLTFRSVPPTEIVVDAGTFALKADPSFKEFATITAALRRRAGGIASYGAVVKFSATDSLGKTIPGLRSKFDGFRNVSPSNSAGNATADFSVGGSPYRGLVYITAAFGGEGTISGTDSLIIVSPGNQD